MRGLRAGDIMPGARGRLVGAGLGVLALVLMVVLPVDSPAWVAVSVGTQLAAVAVFLVVALRMPRRARAVWWTLWVYMALTVSANVVYDVYQYHLGMDPFPSWADLLYVAAYVPQIVALIVLMRQRQRVWDRQAWIDSAVITVAAVSVATTFVLVPMLTQPAPADASTILALAYPVLDLVVLAILIRLTVGGGRPMAALVLLTASVAVTLTADLVHNGLAATGSADQAPGWLEALYLGGSFDGRRRHRPASRDDRAAVPAGHLYDVAAANSGPGHRRPDRTDPARRRHPRRRHAAGVRPGVGVHRRECAGDLADPAAVHGATPVRPARRPVSNRRADQPCRTAAHGTSELIRAVAAANAAGMPRRSRWPTSTSSGSNDAHRATSPETLCSRPAPGSGARTEPVDLPRPLRGEEFALILSGAARSALPSTWRGCAAPPRHR
ncbi:MAG: hypothetical protein IPO93_17310 [Actinobacteria bacterium]|nr:hypothetical protein [Actinomycetota bacterium]